MVKSKLKILSILSLILAGVTFVGVSNNAEVVEAADATNADTYYSSLYNSDGSIKYKGDDLKEALRTLISTGTTNKGYDDLDDVYKTTDVDPTNSGKVILYYTGESRSYGFSGFSGSINREHVWCQSLFEGIGKGTQTSPYSDAHQVRPCDSSLNSSRSNSYYDVVTSPTKSDSYGNVWTGSVFYPQVNYRGDAARTCFYVDTRYEGLKLSTTSNKSNQMGNIHTLLEWNLEYAATDIEIRRNEEVAKIQKNRNPFIDHPEYAAYIYEDFDSTTRSIVDKYTYDVTFNTNGGSSISTQKVVKHAKLVKPTNPTKSGATFVGWYTNSSLTTAYDFNTKVTGNVTLYAKWSDGSTPTPETKTYTVSFDTDGGSSIASQEVEEGNTVTKPTNPTKEGYTFDGWTLNGSSYNFSTPVTGNITLVATWSENDSGDEGGNTGGDTPTVGDYEYKLVTDETELSAGDNIIIANSSKGVAAGALSGSFLSKVNVEFNEDSQYLTSFDGALIFTLGGSEDNWTLSNNDKLLGVTSVKNLAFGSGTSTWKIDIENNNATIQSTTSSLGRFLYNVSSPRFTTYTSNTSTSMLLPQIYKAVNNDVETPGGEGEKPTPSTNEFINQEIETQLGFSFRCEEQDVNTPTSVPSEVKMDFSSQGYKNAQEVSSLTVGDVSVSFNKGTNTNVPKYYTTGPGVRVYGGGYLTISSSKTITKINIEFGSDDGSNKVSVNVGSYSNNTWTGSANSVKFTIGGSSGHRRFKTITTTIENVGSDTTTKEVWSFNNFYLRFKTVVSKEVFEAQDANATFGVLLNLSSNAPTSFDSVSVSEFNSLYTTANKYLNIEINSSQIKEENGSYVLTGALTKIPDTQLGTNITAVFYVKNGDTVTFSNTTSKSVESMVNSYLENTSSLTTAQIEALNALKETYSL